MEAILLPLPAKDSSSAVTAYYLEFTKDNKVLSVEQPLNRNDDYDCVVSSTNVADYAKIELTESGKYQFDVEGESIKFTIFQMVDGEMKSIATMTTSKQTSISNVILDSQNEYYCQVTSSSKTDEIKENIDLKVGDRVRIVLEKKAIGKNRTNLSNEAYIIDSKDGNSYIIKAEDGSIDKYSAYRLVKCDDRYKLAKTIKEGKRGIVEEILAYDSKNDRYKVRYETSIAGRPTGREDTIEYIPSKNLREANPLKLSQMEREYWVEQDDIPIKIRKYM